MIARLPPLTTLRAFEAAARLGSFSRAAEEISVTHSAVSHQVRALERALGTPLFQRNGKRVSLTEAGRHLAGRVGAALREIADAAQAVRRRDRGRVLTVSTLPSFAARWLMPRLGRFMERHPEIDVNLHVYTQGSGEIERYLVLWDRLRENSAERDLYGQTKRDLAARHWTYVQNYADAKSEVVEAIIVRARAARLQG